MTKEDLSRTIDAFISRNREDIIRDIGALVAIESVRSEPAPGAPYGAGPRAALDAICAMAERMGLPSGNYGDRVGYAELAGESPQYIASFSHLDIVPPGNGWKASPYQLRNIDGWLIARGVSDNKASCVLCLYLLKFFQEQGVSFPYTVRALFGTDEECGMSDADYYLAHNEAPLFLFTPDGSFPAVCGEKGIFQADLISKELHGGRILDFHSGSASNVIPDKAYLTIQKGDYQLKPDDHIQITDQGDAYALVASGKCGHAAFPQSGDNAIARMVRYVLDNDMLQGDERAFFLLLDDLHRDTGGAGLGVACSDELFTPLTCCGDIMSLRDGRLVQNIDIRYPASVTDSWLAERIQERLRPVEGTLAVCMVDQGFCMDPNSCEMKALQNAYEAVTGKSGQPRTTGGGSYARKFPSAAAFGIGPETKADFPPFVGGGHGAEEGLHTDHILTALKILILAVDNLQQGLSQAGR